MPLEIDLISGDFQLSSFRNDFLIIHEIIDSCNKFLLLDVLKFDLF